MEDVDKAFIRYFQSLFSTTTPTGIGESITDVDHRMNEEMNSLLMWEFALEEIDFALSQMHPLKAPRLDGFSACFYQQHWATVGGTIRKAVLTFLNSSTLDVEVNATFIALIPKVIPSTNVT